MKTLIIASTILFSATAFATTGGVPNVPCVIDGVMVSASLPITECGVVENTTPIALKERPLDATHSYDWLSDTPQSDVEIALKERPLDATHSYDWLSK